MEPDGNDAPTPMSDLERKKERAIFDQMQSALEEIIWDPAPADAPKFASGWNEVDAENPDPLRRFCLIHQRCFVNHGYYSVCPECMP